MIALLLWLGCTAGKGDSPGTPEDSACDPSRYAEAPGMTPDGGSSPWPCEDVCEAADAEGRTLSNCYYISDQEPICQYGEPCPD